MQRGHIVCVCVLNEKHASRYQLHERRCTVYDKCSFTARYECMYRFLVKTCVRNPSTCQGREHRGRHAKIFGWTKSATHLTTSDRWPKSHNIQRYCFISDVCTGWAKKVIPLVQRNVMYERYHFFGPPCISLKLFLGTRSVVVDFVCVVSQREQILWHV